MSEHCGEGKCGWFEPDETRSSSEQSTAFWGNSLKSVSMSGSDKTLGQVAYEAAFESRRTPKAHTDYPPVWDRVARAVKRAFVASDTLLADAQARQTPEATAEGGRDKVHKSNKALEVGHA